MANLEAHNPSSVKIGSYVQFSVKDINDHVLYSGQVVAITDYQSARAYADVAAEHQAMLQADSSLGELEHMRFLIVECHDGVRRPFAFEPSGDNSWFRGNEVIVTERGAEYKIKLYHCSESDAQLAVRILREQGIACRIVE